MPGGVQSAKMDKTIPLRRLAFLLLVLLTACGRQQVFRVNEVVQNVERLDGKTIRVRGLAYLWMEPSPSEMGMTGGCIPTTDPSYRPGVVTAWLILYESLADLVPDSIPSEQAGIKISEESFRCDGDYCKITCSSFEVVPQRMYEFVGALRVSADSELILEDIDLDRSRQLVDGQWLPISTGDFDLMFP